MLKYMLDTNIVIYVINRRPIEVLDVFNRYLPRACISSVTLAELLHGVEKSSSPEYNRRQVEEFVSLLDILEYGPAAASHYDAEVRFPDDVKEVIVRVVGHDRILSPVNHACDSFFLSEERVTDDFMTERASQEQPEREPFE